MKKFNNLTEAQIAVLESQGCTSSDWNGVKVSEGFDVSFVRNVRFYGSVTMGRFGKSFALSGGLQRHSGIFNASLHNVAVGDDCLIENVNGYISNCIIGTSVLIRNVTDIIVDSESAFGNGVECNVLDETGSLSVRIHDRLSSHEAYLMTQLRDRKPFIDAMNVMIDKYIHSVSSSVGIIGDNSLIIDVRYIRNVKIGPCTEIFGTSRLKNGSINSNADAPVHIGQNVIMDDFIVSSGSRITDGVTLTRCFVGQACELGHNYSAGDSLFFSNCQGENGEACALFAGPYTVTHHKSTLLIAGMFSFMNAGSGSNQSNHLYKLGPIHHGMLQRGAKTTSDSYVLWPARIGPFSLVMGRHINNVDTLDFPFSYLIEQQGVTCIVPGVNLKSVGTIRDVKKWPKRDKRSDPHKLDKINFNHLSPFTVAKMLRGKATLDSLRETSGSRADTYSFGKAIIRNSALFKGLRYYDAAIVKFLGNSLISRMQKGCVDSDEALRKTLVPDSVVGSGEWMDLSGLIAPETEIESLCRDVESGVLNDLGCLDARFQSMLDNYYSYEWTWAYKVIGDYFQVNLETITRAQAVELVRKWESSVVGLDKLIYEDARKECAVYPEKLGTFADNPFVREVADHIARKTALAEEMTGLLSL